MERKGKFFYLSAAEVELLARESLRRQFEQGGGGPTDLGSLVSEAIQQVFGSSVTGLDEAGWPQIERRRTQDRRGGTDRRRSPGRRDYDRLFEADYWLS